MPERPRVAEVDALRDSSLGCLPRSIFADVVSRLDGPDVARLGMTCRAARTYCSRPAIWRALARAQEPPALVREDLVNRDFTWKQLYAWRRHVLWHRARGVDRIAVADHARVLRDATTRAEDAERECQSLRKRSEDAEARAHAAENQTRDLETRIEHLERSAKDSARASKGSSLTAEINCALRQELEELGLELATAREETEARLADCERVRADLKVQNEEVAKLEAALCRAEARAGDAEAAHAAYARTVDSLRTELTQMAHKIAELELAAEAGFVERSNLARDAEALERELAEVKTAKETLEGETWTLREELAEATIARLERGAAGGSDASPAAGDDSADAVADVAAGLAVDTAADAAVEAAEAKKGRPAPRTPILADGRSSVSSLSFSVSSSNGFGDAKLMAGLSGTTSALPGALRTARGVSPSEFLGSGFESRVDSDP